MSSCVRRRRVAKAAAEKSLQPSAVFHQVGVSRVFGQTKHTLAIGLHDSLLWSQHWALQSDNVPFPARPDT